MSKILVVDGGSDNVRRLSADLEDWDYEIVTASSGAEAISQAEDEHPDLILLDITTPEMDGIAVCQRLKASDELKAIPVILISAHGLDRLVVAGLDAGAQDYIDRPHEQRILGARVRNRLRLKEAQDALEKRSQDLARAREEAEHLATHDPLTGLVNRSVFLEHAEKAVNFARRYEQEIGLLFIGLDHFKKINDSLGHTAGDAFLESVAARLQPVIRASDITARLGGDEFTVLLLNLTTAQDAAVVSEKILEQLSVSHEIQGQEVVATPSIGIAIFPGDGEDADSLLRNANLAMYEAKSQGRARYQFFTQEMNRVAAEQRESEARLANALLQEEFILHYQPQVDARTGAVVGAEALVRWEDPERGLIPPLGFIPIAEKTGLINPLGEWILRSACMQRKRWDDAGLHPFEISINVSPRQLQNRDFVDRFSEVLSETGLEGDQIQFEVTESCLMNDVISTSSLLRELAALGAAVVVDDFGTGYSSLGRLRQIPVNIVKIDRSFVSDINSNAVNESIASAVITLARGLKLQVIAEGVETEAERDRLLELGCPIMQGYLFSKPVPPAELEAFVQKK